MRRTRTKSELLNISFISLCARTCIDCWLLLALEESSYMSAGITLSDRAHWLGPLLAVVMSVRYFFYSPVPVVCDQTSRSQQSAVALILWLWTKPPQSSFWGQTRSPGGRPGGDYGSHYYGSSVLPVALKLTTPSLIIHLDEILESQIKTDTSFTQLSQP